MHYMLRNLLSRDLQDQKVIRAQKATPGIRQLINRHSPLMVITFQFPMDTLSILGGNKVGLTNQIQDLTLDVNNVLKITKNPSATAIDLSKFTQTLSYNSDNYQLSLSNGGGTASLGQIIAFRAGIASTVNLPDNTPVAIVFNQVTGVYY